MAQQQLRDPVPGSHQVTANILAGTDQITGCLLSHGRDTDTGDLPDLEQLGQKQRVLGIGLDPVTGGPGQPRRGRDLAADPRSG